MMYYYKSFLSSRSDSVQVTSHCFGPTLSVIRANIDHSIQVQIPRKRSSQSFVTKLKCFINSNTTHDVLISKEIVYKSYKEICSGEPKKVNLGYFRNADHFKVEDNSLVHIPRNPEDNIYGRYSSLSYNWEVLSKFFSMYNIEPNWLDCNYTYGWYDDELGEWTGCMGKV